MDLLKNPRFRKTRVAPTTEFGRLMRLHRERKGWTMTDLSGRLSAMPGINYLGEIERGARPPPSLERALEIAEVLEIPPKRFLHAWAEISGSPRFATFLLEL